MSIIALLDFLPVDGSNNYLLPLALFLHHT